MHICDALKHKDVAQKSALSALVLWNNGITSNGMESMAIALVIFFMTKTYIEPLLNI